MNKPTLYILLPETNDSQPGLIDSLFPYFRYSYNVRKINLIDEYENYAPESAIEYINSVYKLNDIVIVLDLGYLNRDTVKLFKKDILKILLMGDSPQSYSKLTTANKLGKLIDKITLNSRTNFFGRFVGIEDTVDLYDKVLTSDLRIQRKLDINHINASWFPYWFNGLNIAMVTNVKKEFDLVTVMSPRRERAEFLDFLSESTNFTFSNGYGKFGKDALYHYLSGTIGINFSSYDELTIRYFECMGLGIPLITNVISADSGIFNLFLPGRDLLFFSNFADLENKIMKLLADPAYLAYVAKNGHSLIHRYHLASNRATQLSKIMISLAS